MRVCDQCFNDDEIKRFILSESNHEGTCDCCDQNGHLVEIAELLDFFLEFVSIFKLDEFGGRPLINIVQEDWDIFSSHKIANKILSEIDFSSAKGLNQELFSASNGFDLQVSVSYIDEIVESILFWSMLKDDIKWKRRFFADIDEMTELGWDAMFNVITIIDEKNILYRSRINQDGQLVPYPINEMGTPPNKKSTAGRANPQGIPYLYLSRTIGTTLYESRATFLDNISVGYFCIKAGKEVTLVDFTKNLSPFGQVDIKMFTKAKLTRDVISKDLSEPLRRYDSELEYIPTQFICEYIRFFTKADGIQFYSSLEKGGVNVVLFNQENIECTNVELHQITEVKINSKKIN